MKRIMTVMLAVIYITTGTISVMAGEPENNDAQKKESVSDSVKVQTSENTDEDRPKENSWRYSNGELIPQEDDATSNARAVTNAWKKVNGQFVNSLGKPIPGAKKKGMDISEYQGTINWDTVKNRSDIDFVIIRCSYGSGYKDRKWEYNVKECERLGIPYGVYIYSTATTVLAVEKEAENVKKMLEGHQPTYPVYFDMEENSVLNLGSSTIGKLANTFCSKISGAGYKVGIYASLYWWNSILTDRVFKNESWSKWVAQYSASCQYQSKYDMWQYTSMGKIAGVTGKIDMNDCYFPIPKSLTEQKPVQKAKFTVGKNYTLQANMFVRDSANGKKKKYTQLTTNAKSHAVKQSDGSAVLKKGTVVTVKAVATKDGATWVKIPSGWLCGISANGKVYIR